MPITMTEAEYHEANSAMDGFCVACGSVCSGPVEPDAEKYTCDDCGRSAVYGIEQALICGLIDIA